MIKEYTLREISEIVVYVVGFLIALTIVFFTLPKKGDVIRIDCTWSEISPDFSNEMREACRQLRAKNNLQKPK
jgi:uncharacterized membrane protein YgaE (UPF0421/DUF939 family)